MHIKTSTLLITAAVLPGCSPALKGESRCVR